MNYTKQVKAANVLNNAFAASGYNGGDGESLCGTAHPILSGANQANKPATDADLDETSMEAALIAISNYVDERGLKINVQGKKLIIPANLAFVAERLLKSELRIDTANNDINAIRSKGMLPQGYVVNNYLTDTDAWFIKTDAPNGLKHFQRAAMKTGMEGDFETGNVRYKARERYSFGWSDWRAVYGTQGA